MFWLREHSVGQLLKPKRTCILKNQTKCQIAIEGMQYVIVVWPLLSDSTTFRKRCAHASWGEVSARYYVQYKAWLTILRVWAKQIYREQTLEEIVKRRRQTDLILLCGTSPHSAMYCLRALFCTSLSLCSRCNMMFGFPQEDDGI